MPVYQAECKACGAEVEYFRSVAEYADTPNCAHCGTKTTKVIRTAPMGVVKGSFDPFKSPVDGSTISTARELANHNARNNVVNLHDGYSDKELRNIDLTKHRPQVSKQEIKEEVISAMVEVGQGYKPTIAQGAEDEY